MTLKIAAKYAQYTNFSADPRVHPQVGDPRRALPGGRTDYDAIVRSANVNAIVGSSDADFAARAQRIRDRLAGICGDAAADAMMAMNDNPATRPAPPSG